MAQIDVAAAAARMQNLGIDSVAPKSKVSADSGEANCAKDSRSTCPTFPKFSELPREIRDVIYELALVPAFAIEFAALEYTRQARMSGPIQTRIPTAAYSGTRGCGKITRSTKSGFSESANRSIRKLQFVKHVTVCHPAWSQVPEDAADESNFNYTLKAAGMRNLQRPCNMAERWPEWKTIPDVAEMLQEMGELRESRLLLTTPFQRQAYKQSFADLTHHPIHELQWPHSPKLRKFVVNLVGFLGQGIGSRVANHATTVTTTVFALSLHHLSSCSGHERLWRTSALAAGTSLKSIAITMSNTQFDEARELDNAVAQQVQNLGLSHPGQVLDSESDMADKRSEMSPVSDKAPKFHRFLDLPRELRDRLYELALVQNIPIELAPLVPGQHYDNFWENFEVERYGQEWHCDRYTIHHIDTAALPDLRVKILLLVSYSAQYRSRFYEMTLEELAKSDDELLAGTDVLAQTLDWEPWR
ncbi:hypothetical protein LTR85_001499 [Meristemomyces frigidus]|nr:hypothetical protein LTR85_001499 [Meristemomyces frigidus]